MQFQTIIVEDASTYNSEYFKSKFKVKGFVFSALLWVTINLR